MDDKKPVAVIGAGPAGLFAAYELARRGAAVLVFEKDRLPGGIARTIEHNGFRFDIGGHRFFTKNAEIEGIWKTLLADDLLLRPRLSRIYYNGRFYHYPLKPLNALRGLGPATSLAVGGSYLWSSLFPVRPERSFEDWVSNRFGRRLYDIFFKTYTEKAWGIPCSELSAKWAAQRIRGLSLFTAVAEAAVSALGLRTGTAIRTLAHEFLYPRLGPGMMWEALVRVIEKNGGRVFFGSAVTAIGHEAGAVEYIDVACKGGGFRHRVSHVLTSMPLRELFTVLRPAPAKEITEGALRLRYRDFLTVALIIDHPDLFPDNWIYVHDQSVRVGRIQNFKNWSPAMVPDPSRTCLGMEYFCFDSDDLWRMDDAALVSLAKSELVRLGLSKNARIEEGVVVRMPKAYPMYDEGSLGALSALRHYLGGFANLQEIGRNGLHRYNNMDHSMLTGLLAARNILGEKHDIWKVYDDDSYLEDRDSRENGKSN